MAKRISQTFILRDSSNYQSMMQFLVNRNPDVLWEVIIREYQSGASPSQRGYLWGVVYPTIQLGIRESCGQSYSCDEIHEWMRDKFLPTRTITINGETKVVRPSTTKLTVKEFSDYLEQIIVFCAESGIVIPDAE